MTYTVVQTYTRQNSDTDWYVGSDEKKTFGAAQRSSGAIASNNVSSVSDNGLVKTITSVFRNEDAMDAINADSKMTTHKNARNAYCTENNIARATVSAADS